MRSVTVREWLTSEGLSQYVEMFEQNRIELDVLGELTERDLQDLSVPLGDRKRLLRAIRSFTQATPAIGAVAPIPKTSQPQAERRQLTVLFCDLVGSTALAERLDPEDLRDLLQTYQRACGEVIARYDGHVAQYLGDGVMVYFGWPRAHEDDPVRAIQAALEILEAVSTLKGRTPICARMGIHTGVVVIGETGGGDASVPKAAVGETPNIAARLQGLADSGTVVVSEHTRALASGLFEYADLGLQTLKGMSELVRLHRVLRARVIDSRFDASRDDATLTPLVGREEEVALLLRRWQEAKEGEGQVVMIGGEAGIGKSRLTRVLRERLTQEPYTALRYQSSPYHLNSTLSPIIEQFERAAGFTRDDSAEQKLDKLQALLAGSGTQVSESAALFAAMLSLPVDRYRRLNLSPQKQKEKTLEALAAQVEALAQREPLLMIYEDAHWIDPTTQEALDLLVPRLRRLPVLLIMTYRPEYSPRWSDQAHVTLMSLNRLGRRQGTQLMTKLTRGKPLPFALLEQILEHTDGVPLFIEELTKTVLESGLVSERADDFQLTGPLTASVIPSTLRDSLVARLDRLAPVKEVAQIGACIGREFSYALIAAISPLQGEALEAALDQLARSELIFRRGTPPEATYIFKHALVQDAAYDSLLKSRRQFLHRRIAESLEQHFPEEISHKPELAARHYTDAGLYDKATGYWVAAADRALQRFANLEAIGHAHIGLEMVRSSLTIAARDQNELMLQTTLGMALGYSKGYAAPEIGPVFSRARELCGQVGHSAQIFPILVGLWVYYIMRSNYTAAEAMAQQILTAASQLNDANGIVLGRWTCCGTDYFQGRLRSASEHGDAGWAAYKPRMYEEIANAYGHNPGPGCADWGAAAWWHLGYPDKAHCQLNEAIEAATRIMHPPTISTVLVHAAIYAAEWHDFQLALERAERAIVLCEQTGIPLRKAEADMVKGYALSEQGNPAKGIPLLESGLMAWNQMGSTIGNAGWYTWLALAYRKAGRSHDASNAIARARQELHNSEERLYEPELHRVQGVLCLGANDIVGAEGCFHEGIRIAREIESRSMELRIASDVARLWQSQSKGKEAFDLLSPIYNWFTEGFDTQKLKEAKALLEELP